MKENALRRKTNNEKASTRIDSFTKRFQKAPISYFLKVLFRTLNENKYSYSYSVLPMKVCDSVLFKYKPKTDKIAIVMQGPLRKENNFTLETVKYYHKAYTEMPVVISTWLDEDKKYIEKLRENGAYVVKSEKPEFHGHKNINLQLISSKAGVKAAAEMGARFICKTRTDQRINKLGAFEFMYNLLKAFPSSYDSVQDNRLIALGMNYGNVFFPYFLSDFLFFGSVKEMMRLVNIPLDKRNSFEMPRNASCRDYSKEEYPPEIYIMKRYFESLGYKGDNSVKDYWECLRSYMICLDKKTLNLMWPKYPNHVEGHTYYGDYFIHDIEGRYKTLNFDFLTWFNLYSGTLTYNVEYEKFADVNALDY